MLLDKDAFWVVATARFEEAEGFDYEDNEEEGGSDTIDLLTLFILAGWLVSFKVEVTCGSELVLSRIE